MLRRWRQRCHGISNPAPDTPLPSAVRRRTAISAALVAACAAGQSAVRAQSPVIRPPGAENRATTVDPEAPTTGPAAEHDTAPTGEQWQALFVADATPEDRVAAAAALADAVLGADRDRREARVAVLAAVDRALTDQGSDAGALLLAAMSDAPAIPAWLDGSLVARLSVAGADPATTDALARTRTHRAASALVAAAERPDGAAARAALRRLAGVEPAPDATGADWAAWLAAMPSTEPEWSQALVARWAGSAEAASRAAVSSSDRAIAWARRLHLALPASERGTLVAELMLDSHGGISQLGFELAMRAEPEASPLALADAAVRLLASADVATRTRAARLLDRLALESSADSVHAALAVESHAGPADALLTAASRWPRAALLEPALAWFGHDTTRPAAGRLLWAMERAGLVPEPARARVLAALEPVPHAQLSASSLRLLAQFAPAEHHVRLAALLVSDDSRVRLTAADALSDFPAFVDDLVTASMQWADVGAAAARAVREHGPTAERYLRLAEVRAEGADWASQLQQVAARLPAGEVRAASATLRDPVQMERVLAALTDASRGGSFDPERLEGILELAEIRLGLGRPDSALEALDLTAGAIWPAPLADRATQCRLEALLRLERLDDAAAVDGDPAAWLGAMERAFARGVVLSAAAERLRAFAMTDDLVARLDAISVRTPRTAEVVGEPGGGS